MQLPRSTGPLSSSRSSSRSRRRSGWRAGRASTTEFFTSGRAAPWWLIGVSMVATTFSTDTPNLVTNLVREGGIAANWVWWAFLLTGMTTVFFYARLWRRLGVLTDLEFYELRYSGAAATWVRGFRAIYLGVFFNVVIMAAVNLAAAKIANVLLGWPMGQTLLVCGVINVAFAATSGLWGVLVTDFIQFGIAMGGSFAAAVYALRQPEVGGLDGLLAKSMPDARHSCPTSQLDDRAADLHHPAHRAVVGDVVSGVGARRRQLHRAAHAGGQVRTRRAVGHAALQRRALRAAAVALDHRRAGVDDGVPRGRRHPARACRTSIRRCSATTWPTRRC